MGARSRRVPIQSRACGKARSPWRFRVRSPTLRRMDTEWFDESRSAAFDDERGEWLEKWPRRPDGRPSVPRKILAYREREPGRLQLRVPLRGDEGVCDVVVDEDEKTVRVRALVCYDEEDGPGSHERVNCPVHVYLDRPLQGRQVVDVQTGAALPLFVPSW